MRAPAPMRRADVEDLTLRTIRENPGSSAGEIYGILVRGKSAGASFAAIVEALRYLQYRGEIERSEGRYWTDCECWGRV